MTMATSHHPNSGECITFLTSTLIKGWCSHRQNKVTQLGERVIKVDSCGCSFSYSFRTCHLIFNVAGQHHSLITTALLLAKQQRPGHQQLLYLKISVKLLLVTVKTEVLIYYFANVEGFQNRNYYLMHPLQRPSGNKLQQTENNKMPPPVNHLL